MNKDVLARIAKAKQKADIAISSLSPKQKESLEKKWDIEHAYYSSALEGSILDRKEFDALAKKESN